MPKNISAALESHFAGTVTTINTCIKIKRKDDVILGFTNNAIDIDFNLGDGDGNTVYQAASAFTSSDIETSTRFAIPNLEIEGILDSASLSDVDLRVGRYDFADITVFLVNRNSLGDGSLIQRTGFLGEVSIGDQSYTAEIRG